ncbi:MAG: hypothetical protein OES26_00170 [Gammaproteobacteria bacterium]|nr:hypothetical protein [Gammaproteobacteria bacterium]
MHKKHFLAAGFDKLLYSFRRQRDKRIGPAVPADGDWLFIVDGNTGRKRKLEPAHSTRVKIRLVQVLPVSIRRRGAQQPVSEEK